jgi:SAM-dependent methyltransferase
VEDRIGFRQVVARAHSVAAASRRNLRRRARFVWPPVGLVRFGSLRRLTPISRRFGSDRGRPIDRYYIESFLARHAGASGWVAGDIRGRVLEVGEDLYARKFGGWHADGSPVTKVDVLSADASNPRATVVADLASGEGLEDAAYDCVICTQTLLLIYEVRDAVRTIERVLAPGGVLLATVPGISQLCRPYSDLDGDYWRFTSRSARRLFEEFFPPQNVTVEAHGNVLSAIAFLEGIAAEELRREELDVRDPDYEVLIAVRARKEPASQG